MSDHRIDYDTLRLCLAQSPLMGELLAGVDLMTLATHPRLKVEEWNLEQCREALAWMKGDGPMPPAIAEYVAKLKGS